VRNLLRFASVWESKEVTQLAAQQHKNQASPVLRPATNVPRPATTLACLQLLAGREAALPVFGFWWVSKDFESKI